jgi:hypothetical protein
MLPQIEVHKKTSSLLFEHMSVNDSIQLKKIPDNKQKITHKIQRNLINY